MKPTDDLFIFEEMVAKQPTTQIAISSLRILYIIKYLHICTMSQGSDVQRVYIWLGLPGYKFLRVASHWHIILHLHLQWQARIYLFSYGSKISTRKYDSRIHLVMHALLLLLGGSLTCLEKYCTPPSPPLSKVSFNFKFRWLKL